MKLSLLTVVSLLAGMAVSAGCGDGGEPPTPTPDVQATQTVEAAEQVAAAATAEARVADAAATAEQEAAELESLQYMAEATPLLDEGVVILGDFTIWMDDMLFEYELGEMFPNTAGGELALARMKDLALRVESLNVPPEFQESHGFWMAANSEMATGMELTIAGAERFEPDLIEQGTAHMDEATRLLDKAQTALGLLP